MAGASAGSPGDSPSLRIDRNSPESSWASVGSLRTPNGVYSASVVAKDYVLTAAHVVAGVAAADVRFALNVNGDLSFGSVAAAVIVHPGFVSPQQPNANDIALVRLARAIPAESVIYRLASQPVALHREFTLVGYGASGDGGRGASVSSSATVKRVGRNVIDAFGKDPARKYNSIALYDFDGPPGSVNRMGGFSLGNDIETIVASGDSGGPCFVHERGQWKLAAVSTFVMSPEAQSPMSTFGGVGGMVLVAPHRSWIETTIRDSSVAVSGVPVVGSEIQAILQRMQRWFAAGVSMPVPARAASRPAWWHKLYDRILGAR
jgi:hypothetical protein